jgi:hypothetical protein
MENVVEEIGDKFFLQFSISPSDIWTNLGGKNKFGEFFEDLSH